MKFADEFYRIVDSLYSCSKCLLNVMVNTRSVEQKLKNELKKQLDLIKQIDLEQVRQKLDDLEGLVDRYEEKQMIARKNGKDNQQLESKGSANQSINKLFDQE